MPSRPTIVVEPADIEAVDAVVQRIADAGIDVLVGDTARILSGFATSRTSDDLEALVQDQVAQAAKTIVEAGYLLALIDARQAAERGVEYDAPLYSDHYPAT